MRQLGKKGQESVSNFIEKTYNILENQENSQIASWTPMGTSFIIKDIKKFQEYILPIYFKHSNFSSFVRQLNMYNFHKVRGDRLDCQFQHEKFKKDQRELLSKIKRKQSESFIISQNLIDEAQVNQSMHESSQNLKKGSEALINLQFTPKDPLKNESVQKNQSLLLQVQNLRRQNKLLKVAKQNKMQKQKLLIGANSSLIGQKFFKLTTCLLAQKLQKQLKIKQKIDIQQNQVEFDQNMNLDQIVQHVLSSCQNPFQFCKYSTTAKIISSQQSNYSFMLKKSFNVQQSPNNIINNNINPAKTGFVTYDIQ